MPGRSTGMGGPTAKELANENRFKNELFAIGADNRAKRLRNDVADTSSESSRILQTLAHLGGKYRGDIADNSIRKIENIKESMAEDAEEGSRRLRSRNQMKSGGKVKKFASGGSVSASNRADGCAQRGKTRGMMR